MKEIELQTDIINAVRERGGAGHKLSHRFSVGVVDLLVKMPGDQPKLIEVKLNERPARDDTPITLDITVPQINFLKDYFNAGMITGILSLIYDRKKGKKLMWGRVFRAIDIDLERSQPFPARHWTVIITDTRPEMLRRLVYKLNRDGS
jgi:hypothetical protein